MSLPRRTLIAGLPLCLAACMQGQPATGSGKAEAPAPWPSLQSTLRPGPSSSPNIATLPVDLRIAPPPLGVPAALRDAVGRWEGWNGSRASGSVALAVEEVTATGGRGTYVFANAVIPPRRSAWVFALTAANELRGRTTPENHIVTVRARADGNLDILWEDGGGNWSSGVISRMG